MKTTINDISNITGVSASTISRVINNNGYVKKETQQIVEEAIIKNGYFKVKKSKARNAFSDIVLIFVESITSSVYIDFISGISKHLRKNGKTPYVYINDFSPENEIGQLLFANKSGIAGVLMLSAIESPELLAVLENISCPVVAVNRYLRSIEVDTVILDNYKVGFMATNLLIKNGHTKITHLAGPPNSTATQDRIRGYKDAMNMAGLSVDPNGICHGDLTYQSGSDFAKRIMSDLKDFTAVFCTNDTMVTGFIVTLYENGMRCPEDVSVICAENTSEIMIGQVKITTIGYDRIVMGRSAAELLLERIANINGKKKTISYSPHIFEGNSVLSLNE